MEFKMIIKLKLKSVSQTNIVFVYGNGVIANTHSTLAKLAWFQFPESPRTAGAINTIQTP